MKKALLVAGLFAVASTAMAQPEAHQSPDRHTKRIPHVAPQDAQVGAARVEGAAPDYRHRGPEQRIYKIRGNELEHAKRHVARFDADKDGKLSQTEALTKHTEHFKAADVDGDGYVTADELVEAQKKKRVEMERRMERHMKRKHRDAPSNDPAPAEPLVAPAAK